MKIPAKLNYACRALLELGLHWPNPTPLSVQDIASRQNIPLKFLTQIFQTLKQFHLVESSRGNKGGFILGLSPQEINLYEVYRIFVPRDKLTKRSKSTLKNGDVIQDMWNTMDQQRENYLRSLTLENICLKARNLEKIAMFTI
jgi:Rrf2 family protein